MVHIDSSLMRIENFVAHSLEKFNKEHGRPSSVGILCCPWSGWVTTHFNIEKTLAESHHNCQDFQFVEFDILSLTDWQSEYENDVPQFEINGHLTQHNHSLGDEKLNELIYHHLKPLVKKMKDEHHLLFLLQMLDSQFADVI